MSLGDLPHVQRALRLAELCDLAYLPPARGAEFRGFKIEPFRHELTVDGQWLGVSGFLASSDADVVVVFGGSNPRAEDFRDLVGTWNINLGATQVAGFGGQVHRGFAYAMNSIGDEVLKRIAAAREGNSKKLWLSGHSLGGALATLAACRCRQADPAHTVEMVYTFGSPRVGDRGFAENYAAEHSRFENRNDLVAFLCPPPDNLHFVAKSMARLFMERVLQMELPAGDLSLFNYRHVGRCQFIDWNDQLQACPAELSARMGRMREAITDHRILNYVRALREIAGPNV